MDAAVSFISAPVLEHRQLARDTYLVRLACPAIAMAIRPGQFVMVRLPQSSDPLLGRPFALYDTVLNDAGEPIGIDIVYLVVGKMTKLLPSVRAGEFLEIWGPLGNGFPPPQTNDHVALVAGGIGQTPFLAHIRELLGTRGYGGQTASRFAERVSLYYGVRTADLQVEAQIATAQSSAQEAIPAETSGTPSRSASRRALPASRPSGAPTVPIR